MWFTIHNQHAIINLLAKPSAKITALIAVNEQGLHISLHAKPHKGEANKALIDYLSELLRLPKTQIALLRGESSKRKQVQVPLTASVQQLLAHPEQFVVKKREKKHD